MRAAFGSLIVGSPRSPCGARPAAPPGVLLRQLHERRRRQHHGWRPEALRLQWHRRRRVDGDRRRRRPLQHLAGAGGGGGAGECTPSNGRHRDLRRPRQRLQRRGRRRPASTSRARRPAAPATTTATRSCSATILASIKCIAERRARAPCPAPASATARRTTTTSTRTGSPASTTASRSANDDELCNNHDDDCDGVKDEDVDLCTSTDRLRQMRRQLRGRARHGRPACTPAAARATRPTPQCEIQKCDCNGPGDCWWDLDKLVRDRLRVPVRSHQRRRRDLRRRPRQRL